MMRKTSLAWLGAGLLAAAVGCSATVGGSDQEDDPYLWLEDVSGDRALDWVRERNQTSQEVLEADPEFEPLRADLLAILDSDDKIPHVTKQGDYYYNFWQDKDHQRGLWRRTTLEEYRKPQPAWEVLLDVDALNEAEEENWVWHGADCLKPETPEDPYERCLVALSRGGADADVTREFDLSRKAWVEGGFFREEAKGALSWIDRDTVYVYTDFGEGSLTESGYPRVVKTWARGTPLDAATMVYEGEVEDVSARARRDDTRGYERDFVNRSIAFYNDELYLRGEDGVLRDIEAPSSAIKRVHKRWLMLELRDPWTVGATTYPSGALLAADFDEFMRGARELEVLFEPSETTSLAAATWTQNHLILNILEDVKNRLYVLTPGEDESGAVVWSREPLAGVPAFGTVRVNAVDHEESDDYFMTVTDYLTPTTLYYGRVGDEPAPLKDTPAFFEADGLAISQHFATSKDGTRIPYFMVAKEAIEAHGKNPTLLYGYGGFEISQMPTYNASAGRGWLTAGGGTVNPVFVVANIRGGGEYGPRWHQAALKAGRHKAYEDFAAVAEDLIARKITSPAHLGIQGGSNGGLLVGNMLVMYPELLGAVVCQVPLLDMKRYHTLLAGASWMAEYGNPDTDDWEFLQAFSPYQNVNGDTVYPPVLFTTSTRDDRVHPGHARKMMARMSEQGHDVLYYENIEGGHGGAADNPQLAYRQALAYTFLKQRLFAAAEPSPSS